MLRTIKLYGHLGRRFGKLHRLDVASPAEAVRALSVLYQGFRQAVLACRRYHVFVGRRDIAQDELELSGAAEIRIVPEYAGRGKGLLQTILGAAMIALAFVPGMQAFSTYLISAGASMVLGGVAQMLTKPPTLGGASERPENLPSYAFDGPVNTTNQGNAVPVLYGRMLIGSQVISAGFTTDNIPA